MLAGGLDELRAFPDIVRAGLPSVDILASLHGPDVGKSVPMISGRNSVSVDVLVIEDATHVGLESGAPAGFLIDRRSGGFRTASVDIDQGSDFDISYRQNFADMPRATRTNP